MNGPPRQRGISLFAAIFLIVVVATVGVTVTAITVTQNISSAQSLDSTRAWFAARARLERAIDDVLDNPANCGSLTDPDINGFTTEIDCTATQFEEGGNTYNVFDIQTAAYRGSRQSGTLVRRDVEAVITDAP